jgi:hypothetical protein
MSWHLQEQEEVSEKQIFLRLKYDGRTHARTHKHIPPAPYI